MCSSNSAGKITKARPHYIGRGFCLPATPKGDEHSLSTQKGEEKEYLSSCEEWRRNIISLLSY
jgi:hypothetical protein